MIWSRLNAKKRRLDALRPLKSELARNLEDWFRVELTYTSNAIEGNTLSRQQTAVILEKGTAVGGKSMREHLEARNHAEALGWIKKRLLDSSHFVQEDDILALHGIILKGNDDSQAGRYRSVPVRVAGSPVVFPNHRKVSDLMRDLGSWLHQTVKIHPAEAASQAHYRLVSIHPFVDGNGRTARLLMNLILMMRGYPPAYILPKERISYLKALERAQLGGPLGEYEELIVTAVERSLEIYLRAARGRNPVPEGKGLSGLLRIGVLARKTGETPSTLRHWVKAGLLIPGDTTPSGYMLFSPHDEVRVRRIRELQVSRLTLAEIRGQL